MDDEGRQKEQTRIGYLIAVLCLLVIALVFVENSNRTKAAGEEMNRRDWYESVGSMLGRLRAHRDRSEVFFQEFLYRTIWYGFGCNEDKGPCTDLGFDPRAYTYPNGDSFNVDWVQYRSAQVAETGVDKKLLDQSEGAAKKLAALVRPGEEIAVEKVIAIIRESMKESLTARLDKRDYDNLYNLTKPGWWPETAKWYAQGAMRVTDTFGGLNSVSYSYAVDQKEWERRWYIAHALQLQPNIVEMEKLLAKELEAAFQSYIGQATKVASFALLGSEVRLDSLQYIVAIMIAVSGLLVLISASDPGECP